MILQEGPKANWRNPEVNILAGFNMQSKRDRNSNFDTAINLSYPRSRKTSSKTYITVYKIEELEERYPAKYPGRNIKINPNN